MMSAERITITPLFANASAHPELAGRRLEVIRGPRGGIKGYKALGGKLAGRTFSRRVIERVFRAPHKSSSKNSTAIMTPAAYNQALAGYMLRHPDVFISEARLAMYKAESYMYKALTPKGAESQTLEERTEALLVLGVLEPGEFSAGKYAVKFINPSPRIELL